MKRIIFLLSLILGLSSTLIGYPQDGPTETILLRKGPTNPNRPSAPSNDYISCYIVASGLYFNNVDGQWDVTVTSEDGQEWSGVVTPSYPCLYVPFTSGEYEIVVVANDKIYHGYISI